MDDEGTYVGGGFLLLENFKFDNGKDNDNDIKRVQRKKIGGQADKNEESYK